MERFSMAHTFSRQQLYDFVWAEPISKLATQFGLSDTGLAKACKAADIPRPPRGHWAKLAAGKKTTRTPLPKRGPGMFEDRTIGGGRYQNYYLSNDEILKIQLKAPVFDEEIELVRGRIEQLVAAVPVPPFPSHAHRQIRRLLEADEERRQKALSSTYTFSWEQPVFVDSVELRRLRLINAVMTALERAGMKPSIEGHDGRRLSVTINDTVVGYTLDTTTQKLDPQKRSAVDTRGPSKKLRCSIARGRYVTSEGKSWEDTEDSKLDRHLRDIVGRLRHRLSKSALNASQLANLGIGTIKFRRA
jgi:hypothetical protein